MTNEVTTPSGGQTIFPRVNFLKTFESRFAQRAANGRIFGASGVTPPDPLEVASGQDANWLGTNVYQVGQTVEARTAAYTGGAVPITYRYRFQFKPTGDSSFINGPWNNTTNSKNPATYLLTETGEIKFQSQASDSSNPVVVINSITDVESVVAAPIITTIGNLSFTLNGNSIDANQPQQVTTNTANTVSVAISGDATPSYSWSVKTGAGTITGSGDTIDFTGTADGTCRISVVVTAPNASDSPQEQSIVFLSTPPAPDPIPALELDFADSLSLVDSISGTHSATLTRASTGTYVDASGVIQTAANDEARFDHDPATGESLGLLIEESRTNVRVTSEPTTSDLVSLGSQQTFGASTETAPDGTQTAILHTAVEENVFNWGAFTDAATIPTTGKICLSVFLKNISAEKIVINGDPGNNGFYGGSRIIIDWTGAEPVVQTPSGTGSDAIVNYGIDPVGNGWYRAYEVIDLDVDTGITPNGYTKAGVPGCFRPGGGGTTVTAGQQFLSWGYVLEVGSFPSSYVKTTGTVVTRAADVCSMTGTNFSSWFAGDQTTFIAEGGFNHTPASNTPIFCYGSTLKAAQLRVLGENLNSLIGGVMQFGQVNVNDWKAYKCAFYVGVDGDQNIAVDGVTNPTTKTAAWDDFDTFDTLGFAEKPYNQTLWPNGTISRLTAYNERLTDAQLKDLTS